LTTASTAFELEHVDIDIRRIARMGYWRCGHESCYSIS
jgi:hypothetical protein